MFPLAACEKEGPAEKAGEEIDETVEKAGEKMEIVLIILLILVIAVAPAWPYSRRWGYYPSGGVGLVLLILLLIWIL